MSVELAAVAGAAMALCLLISLAASDTRKPKGKRPKLQCRESEVTLSSGKKVRLREYF